MNAAGAKLRKSLRALNSSLEDEIANSDQGEENRLVMMNLNEYYSGDKNFDIGYIDTWMGLSPFIVSQINGPLIDVPSMLTTNHAINNRQDADDFIARLGQFDVFAEQVNAKVRADVAKNWIAPKAIIEKTIASLEGIIKPNPDEHPIVNYFIKELTNAEDISDEDKLTLTDEVKELVAKKVYPAYEKSIELQNKLLPNGREASGIWAQPKGSEFYEAAVKALGDTDLTPEQIHTLGLSEVDRITKEMDAILRSEGLTDGSVGKRMTSLNDDPRFLYEDSDAGREKLLADLNTYIEDINKRMPEQFATPPPYPVEVRKFPKSREASAPGGMYYPPTVDGSQPGIYWINLRDIKANPKFDLKTLTYHEANPGHHWQVALNLVGFLQRIFRRVGVVL